MGEKSDSVRRFCCCYLSVLPTRIISFPNPLDDIMSTMNIGNNDLDL